jgi:DNA-binding CsgD family transcriptional regulator
VKTYKDRFIIYTNILFFGWILSFPLYGPVSTGQVSLSNVTGASPVVFFVLFHLATYILGCLLFRDTAMWLKQMKLGVTSALLVNLLLISSTPIVWIIGFSILGVASAIFVLGWSVVYSLSGRENKLRPIMVKIILGANVILLVFTLLSQYLDSFWLLILSNVPLVLAAYLVYSYKPDKSTQIMVQKTQIPTPKLLLPLLCLFILLIYVNGGLMYSVLMPSFSLNIVFGSYFNFVTYIVVLLIILKMGRTPPMSIFVYLGLALLGLAFVIYAALGTQGIAPILSVGLIETSFALLDVFLWVTLGSLSFVYGVPYRIFGLILAANVLGILLGDLTGGLLIRSGENIYLITSLVSSGSVFLAIITMPWMTGIIDQNLNTAHIDSSRDPGEVEPHEILLRYLPPDLTLTKRESEVLNLTLQGLTIKDMAQELCISEHTVKTHLKNIYNKFGVKRKQELILLANRTENEL